MIFHYHHLTAHTPAYQATRILGAKAEQLNTAINRSEHEAKRIIGRKISNILILIWSARLLGLLYERLIFSPIVLGTISWYETLCYSVMQASGTPPVLLHVSYFTGSAQLTIADIGFFNFFSRCKCWVFDVSVWQTELHVALVFLKQLHNTIYIKVYLSFYSTK